MAFLASGGASDSVFDVGMDIPVWQTETGTVAFLAYACHWLFVLRDVVFFHETGDAACFVEVFGRKPRPTRTMSTFRRTEVVEGLACADQLLCRVVLVHRQGPRCQR